MKHKLFTLLFAVTASLGTVFAQSGTCGNNLTWNLTNGVLIISGTGEMTDYNSSSSVPWYSYRTSVQYVVIGNGVTSIGDYAFYYCQSLTSVTISNSVTNIGKCAFLACSGLTFVTIPNSVTSIGEYAFRECIGLTSLTIPNSVTSINDNAFYGCSGLTSVSVENGNPNYISQDGVLFNKSKTKLIQYPAGKTSSSYVIPNSVTSIGGAAFSYCRSLTSIEIPYSVISLGSVPAFFECNSLTSINVENGNPNYISQDGVLFNKAKTELIQYPGGKHGTYIIPNSVTSISISAFRNCTGLTSVTIPNSVTSIGNYAFYNCISLTSLTLPNSLTSMGGDPFSACTGLISINVTNGNPNYISQDGVLFNKGKTVLIRYPCSKQGEYTIPSSVANIKEHAFSKCGGLTSVTIPNSVTSIEYTAFADCSGLTSVTNYAVIPQTIISGVFSGVKLSSCTLYVPAESIAAYRTADVWKNFGTIQAIGGDTPCTPISGTCGGNLTWTLSCDSVLTISGTGTMANISSVSGIPWYAYRDAIRSIVIGNGVTSIEQGAFGTCSNLTSVTIPNSVTSIGDDAFIGCTALTSVTIPSSVTNIGHWAFNSCSSLTSVTLNSNAIVSKNYYMTSSLIDIFGCQVIEYTIGNTVTSIGKYAFKSCSSLTSVVIPDGVTSIGDWAFQNCTALTSVEIPNSLTNIGDEVFSGCAALISVTNYATTPQTIDEYVFDNVNISACTLYVPAESLATYKKATIWKNFGRIQAIGGNTPCLIASGTCGANLTWELTCDSVLTISGTGAMADFNSTSDNPWYAHHNAIKSVIIGDGITSIGKGAFYNCSVLTSVAIGNSVTSIGTGALQNCIGLTSVTIPNSVTSIEYGAFKGCSVLRSVTTGNSVTSIGDYAFEYCSSLTSVEIPNSVTSIGYGAFGNCSGLASVTIDKNLASIGNFAFYNCSSLTSVTNYATTPQTITTNVFGSVSVSSCTLYVPAESLAAYQTADVWKDFGTILAIGGDTPCTPISGTCGANLTWKLSCDSVLTISGTGAMANISSASDIPWYEYRDAIKSIVIGNGVTSIAGNAFQTCTNLTSVTIPNSVTSIGQVAFYECTALTSVTIPNRVTSIGMGAFSGCSSLTSITIPNSVTSIGQAAFGYCTGLRSVTIGSGVTNIEQGLFGNCSSLTSITIPNSVTSIGQVAFIGCTSLTSVTIPNSVTSIGMGAFSGCSSLASVAIPNGITSIEQETFGSCSSLTSVVIPNGVTSIGDWAFQNCTALTSVEIPNSLTNIGDEVFSGCAALISVTNYATTPQTIDEYVFDNVNISACTLYVPAESLAIYKKATIWKNFGTIQAIGGNTPCLIASGTCGANLTWELSCDSVLTISGTGAMADFNSIFVFVIPWYAYRTAIKSVIIGDGVTSIGSDAFYDCTGLTSVTILNSVTSIGNRAFCSCTGLISITIPNSVTSIGSYVFSGCSSLTSVTNYATTPQTITTNVFKNVNISACTLYIPAESLAAYRTADVWKDFGTIQAIGGDTPCTPISGTCGANLTWKLSCDSVLTISGTGAMANISSASDIPWYEYRDAIKSIVIGNGVTSIAGNAFQTCTNLTSVTIPNSVTSIGQVAFHECTALTSVTIPNSVTSIGMGAFSGCSSLTSITIPNSVKSIEQAAFGNCTGLQSVTIGSGVTSIEQGTFGNCSSLTSVTIPNSVTSIGQVAFIGCTSLTSVTIPNSVTSIGMGAFSGCSSLTSVTIPNGITSIEQETFGNCSSLTTIVIPNNVTSVGDWAFQNCIALTTVEIPNSVTNIGDEVFSGCTALSSVTNYATTPQTIDEYVFDNVNISACTLYVPAESLATYKKATIWKNFGRIQAIGGNTPCLIASGTCGENLTWELSCDSVLTISGTGAMADYSNSTQTPWAGTISLISRVAIDDGVNSIGDFSFAFCGNLKSVYIGKNVKSIGGHAFYSCYSLPKVSIPNSVLSIGLNSFASCDKLASVTIGDNLARIGNGAFSRCVKLANINIPNSVTEIAVSAFAGCESLPVVNSIRYADTYLVEAVDKTLTSYSIKSGARWIGDNAFLNCTNLNAMDIPIGVISIGTSAFSNCTGLTTVTIPNTVSSIGTFAFQACYGLKSITNHATKPQHLDVYVFSNANLSACTLYVPKESLAAYRTADVWKDFGQILPINAEDIDVTTTTVTASATTADIVWPKVTGAVTYTLEIKKNGELICTITFDAEGHLISMSFAAPSRHNAPHQTQAAGFSFTITGLESGTTYSYTMIVKGSDGNVLKTESGTFTTIGTQGIEDIQSDQVQGIKLLRDGQIYILRGGRVYTMQGQKVK